MKCPVSNTDAESVLKADPVADILHFLKVICGHLKLVTVNETDRVHDHM